MILRALVATAFLALLAVPALAKDRRPGQADPDVTWEKQQRQKDCGRVATGTDAEGAKGKHGQIASAEATAPCTGSGAGTLSGKSGRNDPGRN